jgi:hypothetical protein
MAGNTPASSERAAAISVDGVVCGWCEVVFADDYDWSQFTIDMSDDHPLINPPDLGIDENTESEEDLLFLTDAEEYILRRLNDELSRELLTRNYSVPPSAEDYSDLSLPNPSPQERSRRVVRLWQEHGSELEHLPELIAIELYDAVQGLGPALKDLLDETPEVSRESCGSFVLHTLHSVVDHWKWTSGRPTESSSTP